VDLYDLYKYQFWVPVVGFHNDGAEISGTMKGRIFLWQLSS